MAIERYGSKTDIAVKLVLVFFVCLLSFSVGTFVGKKFSDNQHRLAQFEPTSHERETASTQEGSHEEPKSAGTLSDDEIAKLAEEFVSEEEGAVHSEKAAAPTRSVANAEEPAKPHDEHAPAAAAPVAPAAAPNKAPASTHEKKEAVKPTSMATSAPVAPANTKPHSSEPAVAATQTAPAKAPLAQKIADSAVGKFTVQVGSFATEAEAQKRVEALKAQNLGAFYIRADVTDKASSEVKTWYRVSVGLFPTQDEANAYKTDVMTRTNIKSAIIQKITK